MFDSFRSAFVWWLDGIAATFALLAEGLFGRRRLRLVPSGQGWAIEGRGRRSELRLVDAEGGPRLEPKANRRDLARHPVDVLLAPDAALVRHLDPLPAESRQYLDGIVRHQVERLTPWLASDVLYGFVVGTVGPSDPRLAVTVAATARSLNAPIIAALRAAGVRDIGLLRVEPDLPAPIQIPVEGELAEADRRTRQRRIAGAAVGLAALAAAAAGVLLVRDLDSAGAELAAVQEAIEARRGVLLAAARQQSPAEQRDLEAMIARKREAPLAVLALDAMSQALPDDTFVTEFRLGEGRVRVVGTSRSVAGLVPLVEGTPDFSEAGFFAPTTRLPEGRGDRFHIDARWLPPTAGTTAGTTGGTP